MYYIYYVCKGGVTAILGAQGSSTLEWHAFTPTGFGLWASSGVLAGCQLSPGGPGKSRVCRHFEPAGNR